MMREYLTVSRSSRDESAELEKLANQLSISETAHEVNDLTTGVWFSLHLVPS